MKIVAERLKIDYSRFIEVEVFTKFGAHVEERNSKTYKTRRTLKGDTETATILSILC